ncbi:pimeloyl-ACP methyl ester carboxylesterase [Okibacterium sp. HSC-33S16]|uniref:alpha/beta fold hydrolase n=1 Tax=Okibacterium sp. HSC-33S16 TaxID=2910965 RepID=UPI00209DAD13|nr:alpha/beta hydrolase [Okibacterium sp. HSC-33S16]MCP2032328.1 pimeloyl-ACP methyl ester carboxylesterase [Okibacterium sp. HSC-33S16]
MSQYTAPNLRISAPNGVEYAYRRFGTPHGIPLLFLQHFRGNLDNWDPELTDTIASEREVILFDAAGIGASTGPTPRTFRDFGRDALSFVDALGLTEIDVLGFSIGGFAAQELALMRPGLVRRLILAGTGPQGGRGMHGWSRETSDHAMKDAQDASDMLYLFFTPTESSQARGRDFVERIFSRIEGRDDDVTLSARDAQAEAISDWGIRDFSKLARLASITAPTLVINGDNDIMVPTVNSYLLAGHLPDARLKIYPNANHGFLFEYPLDVARDVNDFLAA